MNAGVGSPFGYMTIFGFTQDLRSLEHRLHKRLEIVPRTRDFGRAGHFFFHTSYGDVAETEEALALKLGFVREPDKTPLATQALLDRKFITSSEIAVHDFRGNALVACFSKLEAGFSVFKTLLSGIPLYYAVRGNEIVCSDQLRCLLKLVDDFDLAEEAIPQHFLHLGTLGSLTYFRGIKFLRPGEILRWRDGRAQVHLEKDLRSLANDPMFGKLDTRSPLLYRGLKEVVGAYIKDIQQSGSDFANLLSGGVDSSVTQLLINEHLQQTRPKSYSFRMHAPSFKSEVEYAEQAQLNLGTAHHFIDVLPEDYPGLVVRATEILGQPVPMAIEPCKLALAEYFASDPNSPHFYFNSQGADGVFGMGISRKIKWLELVGKFPAAPLILQGLGTLLKPVTEGSQTLLKGAIILRDPNDLVAPINMTGSADLDFALRYFGEEAVQKVFEIRRAEEVEYLDSHNYTEKVHRVDGFFTVKYVVSQTITFFLAYQKELVYPYFDEDVLRIGCAIRPEARFIRGFRTVKPVLKDILTQKSTSPAAHLPKLGSSFNPDVHRWMHHGPLREMVMSIERPGFISKSNFEELIGKPNYANWYFLWALLTYDTFKKIVVASEGG